MVTLCLSHRNEDEHVFKMYFLIGRNQVNVNNQFKGKVKIEYIYRDSRNNDELHLKTKPVFPEKG